MGLERKLKLFVIGEMSSDPAEWDFGVVTSALVVAHDAKEAKDLAHGAWGEPIEVPLDKPKLVLFQIAHGGGIS